MWSYELRRLAQICCNEKTTGKGYRLNENGRCQTCISEGPEQHVAISKFAGCQWNFAGQSANTAQRVQCVSRNCRSDKIVKSVIVLGREIIPFANSSSYRSSGL